MTMLFSTRKRPVGCQRDAERAACGMLDTLDDGLFKRVYVDASCKVVYKVAKGARPGDPDVTEGRSVNIVHEVAWVAYLRENGLRGIPNVTLYEVNGEPVEAMPFYPLSGHDRNVTDEEWAWLRTLQGYIDDLHGGNWRRDSRGRPFVIDLGGWGNDAPLDSLPYHVRRYTSNVSSDDHDDLDDTCSYCGAYLPDEGCTSDCECTECMSDKCSHCLEWHWNGCRTSCSCTECYEEREKEAEA
jgi:hypothetical protein